MLQRGTDLTDKDGLLLAIRELESPTLRGHAHAAAVLAADPLDEHGVPRSTAEAKRVAEQRWERTQQRRHEAELGRREAARTQERAEREAEPEAPEAARRAGAASTASVGEPDPGVGLADA